MTIRVLKDKFIVRLLTQFPFLVRQWASRRNFSVKGLGDPWTPLNKPLAECRVAIVTTAGIHLRSQEPFDMKNPNGDCTFREIPDDVLLDELMITHNYYDRRSVARDMNVVFPLDRLTELAGEGRIAGRSPLHLGFMGHIDGPMVDKLIKKTAPVAARLLIGVGADCVLLTPA